MLFSQSLLLEFLSSTSQSGRRFVFTDIEQLQLTGQLGIRSWWSLWLQYFWCSSNCLDDGEGDSSPSLCSIILSKMLPVFYCTIAIDQWIIEAHNISQSPRLNNQVGSKRSGTLLSALRPSQIGKCQVGRSPHHYHYHLKLLSLPSQIGKCQVWKSSSPHRHHYYHTYDIGLAFLPS